MIKIFIYNIVCLVAIVVLIVLGVYNQDSSYLIAGIIATLFMAVLGNCFLESANK